MGDKKIYIGITETGHRVGENHPRAKLSDEEVELMRNLYDEGVFGYRALALAFNVSRNTAKDICTCRRRNATPDSYKPA